MSSISTNILAESVRSGIGRAQLADALGISYEALSRRLRGQTTWRIEELTAVAAALGVRLSDLVPDELKEANRACPPQ